MHNFRTERYCGWFWVHRSSKKFERLAREVMDVCLRVLKESNKSRFDSYSVRNGVLIISQITFRDCRGHIFSDNLSRNSCILNCFVGEWDAGWGKESLTRLSAQPPQNSPGVQLDLKYIYFLFTTMNGRDVLCFCTCSLNVTPSRAFPMSLYFCTA